jgi:polyisoprenoid-binding protein YceI
MYKRIFTLVITLFMLQFSFAADDSYKVDSGKSNLEWAAAKVTGKHNGTINIKNGEFRFKDAKLIGGEFQIDMTSIINLDIEDESWNKKLVDHLNSDDFFSVADYPTATFKITEVKNYRDENVDANYWIIGDLTIKGITNSVEFPAKVSKENDMVEAKAEIELDRTKWNVRYGSGSFFKGLGDKMIYDEFTMKVALNAAK